MNTIASAIATSVSSRRVQDNRLTFGPNLGNPLITLSTGFMLIASHHHGGPGL